MANLFIICGHGAGDPGATGNGYQEAERVRALASRIKHFGGSSVTIGDTSKNWYASNLVNNTNIPKGSLVLELHMDSAAASAKGAHIIIKSGFLADKYDNALAAFLSGMFPGRSNTIVGRSDLANPNRAASAGINYRLAECGFITNAGDVKIFNEKMDEIAKGILKAFDIAVAEATAKSKQVAGAVKNNFGLKYQAHVENVGWLEPVHDGQTAGTIGYGLRMEAIRFTDLAGLKIRAKAHIQGAGTVDYGYITTDTIIGTVGQSKRLEALMIEVENLPDKKNLYIQLHFANDGWGSAVAGGDAGTFGLSKEVQALRVWVA